MHHVPFNIRQTKITTGVPVSQPFVVQAEQVQDGGVHVAHMDGVLHGGIAELIGAAVGVTALGAASGQPVTLFSNDKG